jgi:nitroreductase/NAD-dependent dihydropyrimidine dehydrogenase PreA subunit
MKITSLDIKKCTACGSCIRECPAQLFSSGTGQTVTFNDPNKWCIECGHCMAVCTADAVTSDACEKARPLSSAVPDCTTVRTMLLSKRSIRAYTSQAVPCTVIESILDVMRFAPSGHNAQRCEYIVIEGKEHQELLRNHTVAFLKSFRKTMRYRFLLKPFLPGWLYEIMSNESTEAGIDDIAQRHASGEDPIFFKAPVVMAAHVSDRGSESFIDPTIAFTYGMLTAHAMGIASYWMEFTIVAVAKNKRIMEKLGIPKGRMIAGVMTFGYPVSTYNAVPPRNKVKARWL